ncbi:MAG: efflux RND transporter periplasmic adaptor subunit [Calditrichaeota bacterium]|nr:efflux RND transporter periplasmic adaptor subunit [Calditrichota bacterium]
MNTDLSALRIDKSKRDIPDSNGGSKKWIIGLSLVFIVILISVIIAGNWDSYFTSGQEVSVTVASMQSPAQSSAVLTSSGYVVAQRKASVASKATGRLVYLGVVEGDKVKQNQVVARLEDNDIQAQLAEARANLKLNQAELDEAKNNFDRATDLLNQKAIAKADFDAARTAYNRVLASIDLAQARVKQSEVALENTLIRAPFDGTVLTKNADVGEVVAPLGAGSNTRAAVVTIADLSSLQVEADVSESNLQKITIGQKSEITLDAYPAKNYAGYVAKIIPTADRAKGTVMVKVAFTEYDERVLPEMSVKVLFLSPEDKTLEDQQAMLTVPGSSITQRNGSKVVFKLVDGHAVETKVVTGRSFNGEQEIISGLTDGERIIANPGEELKDGVAVVVK